MLLLVTSAVLVALASGFIPQGKLDANPAMFGDDLLRQVVERMGEDLAEAAADAYLDVPSQQLRGLSPSALALGALKVKELEAEAEAEEEEAEAEEAARRFLEEGGGREAAGPGAHLGPRANHPMTRDREYLQHSSLWGHQYMSGGSVEGKQRITATNTGRQESKNDAVLPAYCNPPNPCPIGYTAADGCLETFDNTASFSRNFQANQDCMCDSEHMFDCPGTREESGRSSGGSGGGNTGEGSHRGDTPHKSLVAKKFHVKKDGNPFLRGEKLPVAAKKGIKVKF